MRPILGAPSAEALTRYDLAVAAVFGLGGGAAVVGLHDRPPVVPSVLLALLCASTVAWRRTLPVPAFVTAIGALVAYQLVSNDPNMAFEPYAVALAAYMAGRRSSPRPARLVLLALSGLVLYLVLALHPRTNPVSSIVGVWVLTVVAALALGQVVARQQRLRVALAVVTARLRAEQEARAARLAAEERNRVARELHDVTAHSVSVMVIQAGAARLLAPIDVDRARRALHVVIDIGREAMDDLRRTVGVLHRSEDDLVEVLPDSRGIETLAERARDAGLEVTLGLTGDVRSLAPGVRFVVYRVVQEALTNAAKHGGPGPVAVAITSSSEEVVVSVTNPLRGTTAGDGGGDSGPAVPGSGHGLTGMRERVAVLGGDFSAGPEGAVFFVRTWMPAADEVAGMFEPSLPSPLEERRGGVAVWWRRPRLVDAGFVGLSVLILEVSAATGGHVDGPLWLSLLAVGAATVALWWRQEHPVAVALWITCIALLLHNGLTSRNYGTLVGVYLLGVTLYSVGAWASRASWAVGFLVFWEVGAALTGLVDHASMAGIFGPAVMGVVAWCAGRTVRHERLLSGQLRLASNHLREEEADHGRLAVVAERSRLARELHGSVARQVSAMVVQAEVAERLLGFDPRHLDGAIEAVETSGRAALAQMRTTLGVLRAPEDRRPLAPQPGIGLAHALVRKARADGREIRLHVDGVPHPLPPALDLIAYRLLEEAIEGQGAGAVDVRLRFVGDALELTVETPERRAWPSATMRQRVELCEGRLNVCEPEGPGGRTRLAVTLPVVVEGVA